MRGQTGWYQRELDLRQQIVLDVGANVGELSQFFWDAGGGSSQVISVEPLAENVRLIEERIERLSAQNWTVMPCAASGHRGTETLRFEQYTASGWNSVVTDAANKAGKDRRTVDARCLTEIAPQATLVKMDIEGHEYVVLDQALDNLNHVKAWALELHMRPKRPLQQVLAQFETQGFSLVAAGANPEKEGEWSSVPIDSRLDWDNLPVAKTYPDGTVFKMIHILARR
jgi:FkbM family methyltransferase